MVFFLARPSGCTQGQQPQGGDGFWRACFSLSVRSARSEGGAWPCRTGSVPVSRAWAAGWRLTCAQVGLMGLLPGSAPDSQNEGEPIGGRAPLSISHGQKWSRKDTQHMGLEDSAWPLRVDLATYQQGEGIWKCKNCDRMTVPFKYCHFQRPFSERNFGIMSQMCPLKSPVTFSFSLNMCKDNVGTFSVPVKL